MTMRVGEAVRLRILELCRERGLSVNKLSALCGMTQSTLNNIVSGRNSSATVATVKKICDGLEISVPDFFNCPLFEDLEQEIR
jgi:DNA-binding Xre family transcriptional regulator